jgi:single-strand DNA-binding protein
MSGEKKMANLNKVFLIGNLTRDPELRYIPSGTAVANFGLATNRIYTTQDGERKEEVCFVDIVTWAKTAENCANYLTKGSPIFIEGYLQFRTWETDDGQKRSKHEVVARNVQFLGGRRSEDVPGEPGAVGPEAEDDIPF